MPELAWWLLLPLAGLAGWYAASRGGRVRRPPYPDTILGPEYFRGINHLLNERPDKAIDVFIRMLEVTADTFETHLALGSLFRRRGEVDRAIRIHQNLAARETLSSEQRLQARFELGRDYLRAGLLGRAEELLNELAGDPGCRSQVLPMLLDIYQQEKDWERALAVAGQMDQVDGQPVAVSSAQFLCELALQSIAADNPDAAREYIARALATDPGCARASIILGDLQRAAGDCAAALAAYGQVQRQDMQRLPEVLGAMADCHRRTGTPERMIEYLEAVIPRYEGIAPVLLQAELLLEGEGQAAAVKYLTRQLGARPSVRGMARLIELWPAGGPGADETFVQGLGELVAALQDGSHRYACTRCGFTGRALHWQCPGCRCWNTVRPVHGVLGI